jgi:hypothetical protein
MVFGLLALSEMREQDPDHHERHPGTAHPHKDRKEANQFALPSLLAPLGVHERDADAPEFLRHVILFFVLGQRLLGRGEFLRRAFVGGTFIRRRGERRLVSSAQKSGDG